jgi:hypothetical protein
MQREIEFQMKRKTVEKVVEDVYRSPIDVHAARVQIPDDLLLFL